MTKQIIKTPTESPCLTCEFKDSPKCDNCKKFNEWLKIHIKEYKEVN